MHVNGSKLPQSAVFSRVEFLDLRGRSLSEQTLKTTEMGAHLYITDLMMTPAGYFYVKVRT